MRNHVTMLGILLLATLAATGCSTTHYRKSADRDVYRIVAEKTPKVPGMEAHFSIESQEAPPLSNLPVQEQVEPFLGEAAEREKGSPILSLEQALSIAVKSSRQYQDQKEALYVSALRLTLARHRYSPIFSGRSGVNYDRTTRDVQRRSTGATFAAQAPELVREVGQLVGTPGNLLNSYAQVVEAAVRATGADRPHTEIVDERRISGSTTFGVNLLLAGGAQIAVGLTSNFLRFITGDPRAATSSALVASISQPLLRGAGAKVAKETLTQAERDVLYQLRSFTRFRQEFVVAIASAYYRVLQERDAVRNNYAGFQAQKRAAERQRAFAAAGRLRRSELGRTEQAQLDAEDAWTNSIRRYRESLDRFKIQLGLSTDAPLMLLDSELSGLLEEGLKHPSIADDDAVEVALAARLDLYTVRDREDDTERRVVIAANALKPGLDLVADAQVNSTGLDRFQELDFARTRWGVGLDVDLPLDRKQERNEYRSALIALDRASRERSLLEDNVKLEVRAAWRDLDQAKSSYEIRQIGVELNERRVEEQEIRSLAGRATALDQIDAQNALISSRNALTAAVVDHTIARLRFWRDMGILYIKENGQWEEVSDDKHT